MKHIYFNYNVMTLNIIFFFFKSVKFEHFTQKKRNSFNLKQETSRISLKNHMNNRKSYNFRLFRLIINC